eukprot:Filipodium_phascolosomae@DN2737_c1_g1_i6.p2
MRRLAPINLSSSRSLCNSCLHRLSLSVSAQSTTYVHPSHHSLLSPNPDEAIRGFEVVFPESTNASLSSNIPNVYPASVHIYSSDLETDGWGYVSDITINDS